MAKGKKYYSDKQEKLIAKYLGWNQVKGSGARPFTAGDVVSDSWVGECKTHVEPNQPIKFYFDVWEKVSCEAHSLFKNPVLFVDDGSQNISNTLCLLDISKFVDAGTFDNLDSYDDSYSIRYNDVHTIEPKMFIRNKKILSVMTMYEFKEFLELGD